jgi:quinol monooxygenase YgiN
VATVRLREMDERTTYMQQLQEDTGPVVLINQFNVAPEEVERFLEVWADDAAFMKRQPGFISTQLHRGTAGSTTFMNVAVWESSRALGEACGFTGVSGTRRTLPRQRRRGATRLPEDPRARDLRGVAASSDGFLTLAAQ